jgi:predicted O-methyltransferase YrrM
MTRLVEKPLRRLRARAQSAREAVEALGFDGDELVRCEREFDELSPALYELLAARAQAASDEAAAARLERPSRSSVEGKRLLYLATRALRPETVVETGPFNGASSAFILRALAENGSGRLLSFDRPDARDALGVPLAAGREPGWLVPDELRNRFELVLGDLRTTLRPRLEREPRIDLFFHDSLHTFRHMLFEFRTAWSRLVAGGLLASDDVFWNPAFWLFTTWHRVPFRHIGTVGVTRKP